MISNNNIPTEIPRIRVIVRKRPLSKKEQERNEMDIIDIKSKQTLVVKELKTKVDMTKYVEEHSFTFDNVYSEDSSNQEIYLETVRPMIEAAFKTKAKITCFAYGQTGSGKTHTMMGPATNLSNGQVSIPGLYLLSGFDLFNLLNSPEYSHLQVYVSFYEIYCGKLHDLLNDRNVLIAREDGKGNICITNLLEKQLFSLSDLMKVIDLGLKSRTVGVTGANADSSRSHGIIQIMLKNSNQSIHGKISFIDLAGSERAQDTVDTNKQTRFDGAEINKSLLALKECIRALDQNKNHTPFRGSKLTMVLRDSFVGGNCKTLMIANISPALICAENSLNTLRYADRVKELKKEKTDKPENIITNKQNDLNQDIARLMMMPRNPNNSVKYQLDSKDKVFNKINSIKLQKPIEKPIESSHMFKNLEYDGFVALKPKSNSNQVESLENKENVKFNFPNFEIFEAKKPIEVKNTQVIQPSSNNLKFNENIDFIYNFNYYKNNSIDKENKTKELLESQIKELTIKQENLINQILKEEDNLQHNHREHIDFKVDQIKNHMGLINSLEQSNSDINNYLQQTESHLNNEIQKINKMKETIKNFKLMLDSEAEISNQISKLNEGLSVDKDKIQKYKEKLVKTHTPKKNDDNIIDDFINMGDNNFCSYFDDSSYKSLNIE